MRGLQLGGDVGGEHLHHPHAKVEVVKQRVASDKAQKATRTKLKAKLDEQAYQLAYLRKGTARGRALFYWQSMKSTRAAQLQRAESGLPLDEIDLPPDDQQGLDGVGFDWKSWRPPTREPLTAAASRVTTEVGASVDGRTPWKGP